MWAVAFWGQVGYGAGKITYNTPVQIKENALKTGYPSDEGTL